MPEPEGIVFLLLCSVIAGACVLGSVGVSILARIKKSWLLAGLAGALAIIAIPPGAFVGMWVHYWITN